MSNSTATLGSSKNDSSASPPPSSTARPPPLASPLPYKYNVGSSPPPSLLSPSSPPPPSSPTRESPPPSSPPSSSKYSPPPNPLTNTPPSNTQAPKISPPLIISTSPPPNSTQISSQPTPPTSSSNAPPPTPSIPISIPTPTPPPPSQASPPPPPPSPATSSSPPIPITISPPGPSTTPSPPPPTGLLAPPSPPISNAPTTPSKSPPFSPGNPQTQTLLLSPPTAGRAPSGNTSEPSPKTTYNSNVSSNSTGHASNGSASTVNSTHVIIGVAVASAFLISLIAIFSIVISTRKKKEASHPHYFPPKSFTVQTDGCLYGQHQNSTGFSGPGNFPYGSQVVPHSPHSPYGCASQKGSMYTEPDSGVLGASTTSINYELVREITNGFARQNIIGEGGFGSVYKGYMPDGKVVAVKQLKAGSGQGDREFKAEVEIISRVHHRHLVSLVGYCIAENQRLLIYEFVPNKTLEHHLHSKGLQALEWTKRLKIALGSAKGLAYLHEDCHPKIIHRDIKSANILLDDDFEAQVADFGLARMNDTSQTHVSTRVMGTFGYLAPEYALSGKLSDRSDVFSFGVVLLELITGRKPVDPTQPLGDESLVEWARPLLVRALETGDVSELVDPRLQNDYIESELLRMIETAAACVRHSAPKRPRMVQVLRSLDSVGELADLSNGVKYGQSTVYDSGQYNEDIIKFRKMALSGLDISEFDGFSGDYTSRDSPGMQSSSEYTSGESETRAMTEHGGGNISQRKYGGY